MELKIPSAEQCFKRQREIEATTNRSYADEVTSFINETVAPRLETITSSPAHIRTNYALFDVPVIGKKYNSALFLEEMRKQLSPLGFTVSLTHDGGGVRELVGVSWRQQSKYPW